MKNDMMFGYMMYFSDHMWDDENTPPRAWYLPPNYSENNATEVEAWDETVHFLVEHKFNTVLIDVGDAIRYESHPEISAPNAWDKDFLRKKLNEMRKVGIEPIPKLNFSTCHHTWLKEYRRMVSTSVYYRVCADVIREVCEVFDSPRLFHLGLDEEDTVGNQRFREAVHIRSKELWWHDVYFYLGEAEKQGARPWVWSDAAFENPETFVERMPKSVLQSNWYYNSFKEWPADHWHSKAIRTYELLDKNGFEQVPTCSACEGVTANIMQTLAHGKAVLSPELLRGYLIAPWTRTTMNTIYYAKHNAYQMYLARQKYYPETL